MFDNKLHLYLIGLENNFQQFDGDKLFPLEKLKLYREHV